MRRDHVTVRSTVSIHNTGVWQARHDTGMLNIPRSDIASRGKIVVVHKLCGFRATTTPCRAPWLVRLGLLGAFVLVH